MERRQIEYTFALSNFAWLWMASNFLPHTSGRPLLLDTRGSGSDGTTIDPGHIAVHGIPRQWNGHVFAIHSFAQHHVPIWWLRNGRYCNSAPGTRMQMTSPVALPDAPPAL
eukprot:10037823-Heterocapsa_arctica.AAC.1